MMTLELELCLVPRMSPLVQKGRRITEVTGFYEEHLVLWKPLWYIPFVLRSSVYGKMLNVYYIN